MGIALLACMDTRLNPYAILGLREGDAHVIRNAGGVVTDDAVRSLAISQHLLGTKEVMVLQHTDCGLLSITDQEFAERIEREAGRRPPWTAHAFTDLDASVRESIRTLEASPFLRQRRVRGFVYDVESGLVREVNSP
jgi:carbonic anhydrase